jgi:hypothetical protein
MNVVVYLHGCVCMCVCVCVCLTYILYVCVCVFVCCGSACVVSVLSLYLVTRVEMVLNPLSLLVRWQLGSWLM